MRVLLCITKSEQGGAQTHVAQLAQWLIREGHEVGIMSHPDGWLEDEAKRLGATFFLNNSFVHTLNPLTLWRAGSTVLRAFRDFEPDVVACHSTLAGLVTRLSLRGRVPTVFTAHGWGFTQGAPLLRRLMLPLVERLTARWTDTIICVSQNDLNLARSKRIVSDERLTLIHNGVPVVEASIRSDRSPIQITFVGRLRAPKLPGLLIESFAELSEEIQAQARITIIGDGPDRESIEGLVSQKGLENQVTLLGSIDHAQVQTILQKETDVFVLLSKWEGFPYAVLEAMAAGVPVIASRVGGIPEMLQSGGGVVVENTRSSMKQVLEELIVDQNKRQILGDEAHRIVAGQFSVEHMCQRTFGAYKKRSL